MKNFWLILLCLIFVKQVHAQPCKVPMATQVFKSHMSQLALMPNDNERLKYSKNMFQESCLLSSQVKDFAIVFTGDYYRYQFCKKAWKHTFDKENFYDVYDSFIHLSNAIRLYDFVNHQTDQVSEPLSPHSEIWYPEISYPTANGYKGITGCDLPMADYDFDKLSEPVRKQNTDNNRRTEALKLIYAECTSISQAMKLASLFELESHRLSFLKEIFPKLSICSICIYTSAIQRRME